MARQAGRGQGVNVSGADLFAARLKNAQDRLPGELDRAADKAARAVERQAKINASGRPGPNVQKGSLRRSIRKLPTRRTSTGRTASVGPAVVYGRAIELGKTGVEQVPAHTRRPPVRRGAGIRGRQANRAELLAKGTVSMVNVKAHSRNVDQPSYPYLGPAAQYVRQSVLPNEVREAVKRAFA